MDLSSTPKAELHCHADGVVDPQLIEVLEAQGCSLGVSAQQLAATLPVTSMSSWTGGYCAVAEQVLSPVAQRYEWILEEHVKRLKAQRVTYAELFVSRMLGAYASTEEVLAAFEKLRSHLLGLAAPELQLELVVCIGRGTPERLAAQAPRIVALWQAGLIGGVALAGDESIPIEPLSPFLAQFRDHGLGIEIHAGEQCGPDSVWRALEYGFATRIGHGVAAFSDPVLVDHLAARKIHLEFCVTSNCKLGVIPSPSHHPLMRAWERGISFSINTDDPGPFECSMQSECELIKKTFGLNQEHFRQIYESTLASRFLPAQPRGAGSEGPTLA